MGNDPWLHTLRCNSPAVSQPESLRGSSGHLKTLLSGETLPGHLPFFLGNRASLLLSYSEATELWSSILLLMDLP